MIEKLKAEHIDAAERRWEEACSTASRFLNYDRSDWFGDKMTDAMRESDASVRRLARKFFEVNGQSLFYALGGMEQGFGIKMNGYGNEVPFTPCALMEFIGFFVGHEIIDDGSPGIAYYRHSKEAEDRRTGGYVRCRKDHPDAQPYFHRNTELLAEEDSLEWKDVEHVHEDNAFEVLDFYEKQRFAFAERMRKVNEGRPGAWDDEDIERYSGTSEKQKSLVALADELTEEREGCPQTTT